MKILTKDMIYEKLQKSENLKDHYSHMYQKDPIL